MEWIWVVAAISVAFYFWRRSNSLRALVVRRGATAASDCEMILAVFRREIANYLLPLDPDRFLNLYRRARMAETAIEAADRGDCEKQLAVITDRFPFFSDFDLVGTREPVSYSEALNKYAVGDIEEHYLSLVKYHALRRALDPDWRFRGRATNDAILEHLQSYVRKLKRTAA
jgi:hypothetical protein